jgi:hypothetical protein
LLAEGLPVSGIERCNPTPAGRPAAKYVRALNAAWGLAEVGGSDAHFPERVGAAYTTFPGTTADDLRAALVSRRTAASFDDRECESVSFADYVGQLRRSFVLSPMRKARLAIRAIRRSAE